MSDSGLKVKELQGIGLFCIINYPCAQMLKIFTFINPNSFNLVFYQHALQLCLCLLLGLLCSSRRVTGLGLRDSLKFLVMSRDFIVKMLSANHVHSNLSMVLPLSKECMKHLWKYHFEFELHYISEECHSS